MKIIDKLSKYLENTLSIEEIIGRAIELEVIISFIQTKFGGEFNLINYIEIWKKKDEELKKIIENESKIIDINKLNG